MLSRHLRHRVLVICLLQVTALSAADVNEDLRKAVTKGQVARVQQLIQQGADPTAMDKKRRTAIGLAAEKGYREILKMLTGTMDEKETILVASELRIKNVETSTAPLRILSSLSLGGDINATVASVAPKEGTIFLFISASVPGTPRYVKDLPLSNTLAWNLAMNLGNLVLVDGLGREVAPLAEQQLSRETVWSPIGPPNISTLPTDIRFLYIVAQNAIAGSKLRFAKRDVTASLDAFIPR